jgi:hypothetical protein
LRAAVVVVPQVAVPQAGAVPVLRLVVVVLVEQVNSSRRRATAWWRS